MPYSQTHLAAACTLIDKPSIAGPYPWLADSRAAYYLGLIGPDARVVAGVPREVTHFYEIPRRDTRQIHEVVLDQCTSLTGPITHDNAAFAAGYLSHLVMDVTWLEHIVMPRLFIEGKAWGPGHPNWTIYNVLMAHLEVRGHAGLCDNVTSLLPQVTPEAWIICLPDNALGTWGKHIARVVEESGPNHVVTLLARSSDMDLKQFEAIVTDEEAVYAYTTPTVISEQIDAFLAETERRSEAAILDYLSHVKVEEIA